MSFFKQISDDSGLPYRHCCKCSNAECGPDYRQDVGLDHASSRQIMDDRYGKYSTVVVSQLPTEEWYASLGTTPWQMRSWTG